MRHKHPVGTPVILRGTGELGTVSAHRPEGGPFPLYTVTVAGRPAIPSRAEGPSSTRTVPENLISLGVTEPAAANKLMLEAMRAMPAGERTATKNQNITDRDAALSTDLEVSEALRYIEAITIVEGE